MKKKQKYTEDDLAIASEGAIIAVIIITLMYLSTIYSIKI